MKKERAIELLQNFNQYDEPNCMGYWDCDECVEALYMGIEAIKEQPERGKWIDRASELDADFGRHDYVCSKCFKRANYYVGGSEDWWDTEEPNYCPNCGARMEEEQ